MYNLLLYSKSEVIFLKRINEFEIIKALKLFESRNSEFKAVLYEYSHFADNEDTYYEVLKFWY